MVKKVGKENMPTWIAETYDQERGKLRLGESGRNRILPVSVSPALRFPLSAWPNFRAVPSSGFTLLELTVVLFIVGLLLVIVVPHLGDVGGARLEATAKRLAAVVRYLSGEAALQNRPYRLNYDLDKHTYWITVLTPTADGAEFQEDESLLSRPVQLPQAITFADVQAPGIGRVSTGHVYTHFLPQGYTDPTLIHLRDQRSHVMTVFIPPLTGEARVYDGYIDRLVGR